MSSNRLLCSVYKSPKKNEMYVYIEKRKGVEAIPEELLTFFGVPVHVFDLLLTPEKKLARVEVEKVMSDIAEKGYFLQMPPVEENLAANIVQYKKSLDDKSDEI